ncbi:DUF5958 family protein [Streptomyces mirabilis]|uniref:DUF5958 family protein n=1 Tax=Streptomyces mirabilis TaxID=68239 RepID=UPI00367A21DF
MADGVEWFEGLSDDDQRKALHTLVLFCGQARAREDDVAESIARSGIRPTHTPAVMLTKWRSGWTDFRPMNSRSHFGCSSPFSASPIPAGGRCTASAGVVLATP